MKVGQICGEGGPFLIADRRFIEQWRGGDGEGEDYARITALGPGGGALRVGSGWCVAWEPEGGCVADVYRHSDDRLLIQREWPDEAGAPVAAPPDPSPTAELLGRLDIVSGALVVLWSPVAWSDVFDPPDAELEAQLAFVPMLDVGLQLRIPSGSYECRAHYADEAYRCWISPGAA